MKEIVDSNRILQDLGDHRVDVFSKIKSQIQSNSRWGVTQAAKYLNTIFEGC